MLYAVLRHHVVLHFEVLHILGPGTVSDDRAIHGGSYAHEKLRSSPNKHVAGLRLGFVLLPRFFADES